MRRQSFVSLLLLLALTCPTWGEEPTVNVSRKEANAPCGEAKTTSKIVPAMPPCHCLQDILQDYPGTTRDLYFCYTHLNNCNVGEEDMFLGSPTSSYPLPQVCYYNQCEPYAGYIAKTKVPGHGMSLTHASAWGMVHAALQSAKQKGSKVEWDENPKYHKIPKTKVPTGLGVNADVTVMAVPFTIKDPQDPTKKLARNFCIQIDSAPAAMFSTVNVTGAKAGTGLVFAVDYTVNGKARKGLVWLK